jgi:hypothetical protein
MRRCYLVINTTSIDSLSEEDLIYLSVTEIALPQGRLRYGVLLQTCMFNKASDWYVVAKSLKQIHQK